MEEVRLERADVELGVLVRSGDPRILFLHGLAGHRGEWMPVIDLLDPSVGIINPDQRAHGTSRRPGPARIDRTSFVADAAVLIEQFGGGSAVVVGHSMGGIVATLLAQSRPDLVKHLVLIETGMGAMNDAALESLRLWFDSWPNVFRDRSEAIDFFGAGVRSTPAWVDGLDATERGLVRRFDPKVMIETMRSLASEPRWHEWESVSVPTTLIRGVDGTIADADVERMLELQPGTELIVVDDSGHDVHLDRPARIVAILGDRL